MAESTTPASTPKARLWVRTTMPTVPAITAVSVRGVRCRVSGFTLRQLKVPTETMIITATSAPIGIWPTKVPSTITRIKRNTPEARVDRRARPPERWLIIDWPIMAQPAMPPRKPVRMLAMPWPCDSRFLSERVSVMSSRSWAVRSDSRRPTIARVNDTGSRICRVSRLKGTSGIERPGSDDGRAPMSPTVGRSRSKPIAAALKTTIATSGDGTVVVRRGRP